MKLNDVYKEWIPVKERQVKNSTLTTYQQRKKLNDNSMVLMRCNIRSRL